MNLYREPTTRAVHGRSVAHTRARFSVLAISAFIGAQPAHAGSKGEVWEQWTFESPEGWEVQQETDKRLVLESELEPGIVVVDWPAGHAQYSVDKALQLLGDFLPLNGWQTRHAGFPAYVGRTVGVSGHGVDMLVQVTIVHVPDGRFVFIGATELDTTAFQKMTMHLADMAESIRHRRIVKEAEPRRSRLRL